MSGYFTPADSHPLVLAIADLAIKNTGPWLGPSHAPLTLLFGLAAGALAGIGASFTRFWSTSWHRAAILGLVGEALLFLGYD